ncbi:MAG: hypothetical protein ACFWTN_11865 [Clostridium sp.]|jgi:hypothetical protein
MKSKNLLFVCLSVLVLATGCSTTNGDAVSSGTNSAAENSSSASVSSSDSSSNVTDPTYRACSEFDEDGLTDNHIYRFSNGSVTAAPGDYLLMINGEFSDADVIIRNDRALVPVSAIQQVCGAEVLWGYQANNGDISPYDSDNGSSDLPIIIKIHNADKSIDIKMTVGQTKVDVNGKTETLDTPPVLKNNTAYVPLYFVCDCFGKVIGYLRSETGANAWQDSESLAFNPIIWVDDLKKMNAVQPTDATLTWLKAQFNQAMTNLKNNLNTIMNPLDPNDPAYLQLVDSSLSRLADDINNTYYVCNIGRYALYQGPYPTLVDVSSKTIYFFKTAPDSCYIQKADMSDPETLMLYYFAG